MVSQKHRDQLVAGANHIDSLQNLSILTCVEGTGKEVFFKCVPVVKKLT